MDFQQHRCRIVGFTAAAIVVMGFRSRSSSCDVAVMFNAEPQCLYLTYLGKKSPCLA